MIKKNWLRFSYINKGLRVFFMINLVLDIVNEKLLDTAIPQEIVTYLFWLSLGLLLGFEICKSEFKKAWRDSE